VSPIDRGSMIRIPVGNHKTARIEVRSVAPDANPYLVLFTILKVGMEGDKLKKAEDKRERLRFLPDNIHDAIRLFKASDFVGKIIGEKIKRNTLPINRRLRTEVRKPWEHWLKTPKCSITTK